MPVFNGEPFLRETLKSLQGQTERDLRIVFCDNASTDATANIAKEAAAADPRIVYRRHPENIGAAANFRYALAQADSEFFMWAAADDLWHPEFISATISALNRKPDAGMALPQYLTVSRRLGPWSSHRPVRSLELGCIELSDRNERVRKFSKLPRISHKDNLVYAMWRREALVSVLDEWRKHPDGETKIGDDMDDLALWMYRGIFVRRDLFFKCYRTVAPGHPLDLPLRVASKVKRRFAA